MNNLTRRRFLKISSATVVAASAVGTAGKYASRAGSADAGSAGDREIPTFCDICFWKCNAVAHVRGGKLWKITGNPDDPMSEGRLCPRGTGGVGTYHDTDRLTRPLIRGKRRGEDVWVESTWDEALEYVSGKMRSIRDAYGPQSMAMFSHGIGGNFLKHLVKAYGSPNITAPSYAQCRGPRDVGFALTFGEDVGSPERTDIRNARCLVLIGSHLGENMHNTQVQEFAKAIEAGATVIAADPRFSVAASKAKYWLPVKPGSDLALILAWMNELVASGTYDKEYVAKHGAGFEEFAAAISPYTPEWAYPETGIEPETIRATAREMAMHAPATLVHPGRHVTWYGDDTQRLRAVALLNALLGSWGRKGGFYQPAMMDVPPYPYPPYPDMPPKADNPGTYPFATEGVTNGIREVTITGKPYPVKGWLVYATNLLQALPNEQETIQAIRNLDLLAVVDIVPSEIAGWADVVLPEASYLERYDDLNVELFREPFISLRQPVMEPLGESRPGWWMAKQLAGRLGLERYFPWKDAEDYLDTRLKFAGFSLKELKGKGLIRGAKMPIYYEEGVPAEFPTPSGKIEFYSSQLAAVGADPVPKYRRTAEPPAGYFRLLFGRTPVHTFGRTQTNPVLMDAKSENEVWVNTDIASRYGLKPGVKIRLVNQDGARSLPVTVKATQMIRSDCVYLVHGFGHEARGLRRAYRKGASDSKLVTRYEIDPLTGATGMNVNFVTFAAAEA